MQETSKSPYEAEWEKIDSLTQQGLPASALTEVKALLSQARKDKQSAEIVKCLIYRGRFQAELNEDGYVKAIDTLRQEIISSDFPEKPLLQSMLAELFQNYLDANRWQISKRTDLSGEPGTDILTWTARDFVRQSQSLYLSSLVEKDKLLHVSLDDYEVILTEGKNNEGLRPNLYDFLAHRAIDYFSVDRNILPDPTTPFLINQADYLGSAANFSQLNIQTPDQESQHFRSLQILQNLIKLHLSDSDPRALIDVDLKRLKFVYDQATFVGKEEAFVTALQDLSDKYIAVPAYTEIRYQLAQFYQQRGYQFETGQMKGKWDFKKASEICAEAINRFPESYGAKLCKALQNNLHQKSLNVQTAEVQLSDQPFLLSLIYRNVPKIYLKVVAWDDEKQDQLNDKRYKERSIYINQQKSLITWSEELPLNGDLREHRVELKVDQLGFGRYLIVVSDSPEFSSMNHGFAFIETQVSNLAYWKKQTYQGATQFLVADRQNGAPLSGVEATIFRQEYNSKKRKYEYKELGKRTSDENGIIESGLMDRNSFRLELRKGEDRLRLEENYYVNNREARDQIYTTTHFFLDRGIYRPGQTVYFKAIPIRSSTADGRKPQILPNEEITVYFFDVNYQEVAKVSGQTNEYGSFSGSFIAPTSGLLGRMTLRSSLGNNTAGFRVEEYKRPKFEVSFEPVKESVRLNDSVKVTGLAKAYAGSNIDGAKVQYRVVREVRYPYWPFWRFGRFYPPPGSKSQEITQGNTQTDANGNFTITFNAAPDLSIDPNTKPTFRYNVMADVVDITGETHSANAITLVGYVALDVKVNIPGQVNADSLKSFELIANNLSGQAQAVSGKLTIHRLQAPEKPLRPRKFAAPDTFVMDESTFKQHFPNDPHQQEDHIGVWPTGEQVWTSDFNTGTSTEVSLPEGILKTGYYEINLQTKDSYGEAVEWKKRITIFDLTGRNIPSQAINFHINEQGALEPGQLASYYFGSAFGPIKAFYQVEMNGEMIEQKWLDISLLNNLTLPITEDHRGNLFYQFSFIHNNRAYAKSYTIKVPWSNKELKFSYETFRDKLAPGQEEEWRIRITGSKKEKIAAEMVAAMYDASLDAFTVNNWNWNPWPYNRNQVRMNPAGFSLENGALISEEWNPQDNTPYRTYRRLQWYGFDYPRRLALMRSNGELEQVVVADAAAPMAEADGVANGRDEEEGLETKGNALTGKVAGLTTQEETSKDTLPLPPPIRTNLKETVFFFPDLKTDANGDIILSFTMNEALTRWKFLGMAYTKDLQSAFTQKEIVTQKELMVMPNAPRFFREDDQIEFTAKVSNLSDKELTGEAELILIDAVSSEPVNHLLGLGNDQAKVPFTVKAGQSARLAWQLKVPVGRVSALTHRVVAKAENFSDGEESTNPVVTNRMLVTETMPLPIRGNTEKTFIFSSMQKASQSTTLQHHRYTLEFTSNPAWYAVQALPYIMEYPYECTEQIFNRYYANALATSVANSHPKVKQVFEQWKNTDAMLSNLSKNQELKSALLEETPWVLAAQSEAEQKKNIGLLFDLNRMADEQQSALNKLAERQLSNGGFAWFPGGRDNWYITQYLVEGMGHLNTLGVNTMAAQPTANLQSQAVQYIDDRIAEHYEKLVRRVKDSKGKMKMEDDHLDYLAIHYLYTRSFYLDIAQQTSTKKATEYYFGQAEKYWFEKGSYAQGMIGLALHRMGRSETPAKIIKSLSERAIRNDELGMYWKLPNGFYWYQHPIETHALMIELYEEVAKDAKRVEELKVWLLKNKQTTHWKTTKATANAVYALLRSGDNWLLEDQPVSITVGNQELNPNDYEREAGTGYFKTQWEGKAINNEMSQIKLNNPNKSIAWGGVYWQYFEQLDKITTFEETPLTIKKALFREDNTSNGPVLTPVDESLKLQAGNKLKVRIELRVDRDMEYVHMKDMRASGFEPLNVLSRYKWQDGLGYYESTRDVATHFFFSYLPRGTYVFEYPLRVVHQGDFSNGITTIQCMYAPEFTSHSEGIRVKVD